MRILFISGEVAPFSESSDLARLVRALPEAVHETGAYETRIMMPRYGVVSERRNRLHEVIRLSGSEITLGKTTEVLKVKVASIPGIRLQVYFMDNSHYFKRKGIFADRQGNLFPDNLNRAVYFAKSGLTTIKNLGWQPDLVHAFGWISGFVPYVLKTEFGSDPLFEQSKVVYTPEDISFEARMTESSFDDLSLAPDERLVGKHAGEAGELFADAVIYPPGHSTNGKNSRFSEDIAEQLKQATSVYEELLSGVVVES